MITIGLSDKMAQKLWKKLQPKQNEVWVYLRNKLFKSTGFPQIIRQTKEAHDRKIISVTFGIDNKWRHCWRVLKTGKFKIPIDVLDEAINRFDKREARMGGGKK